MTTSHVKAQGTLLLVALLALNPVVWFLTTDSWMLAIGFLSAGVLLVLGAYRHFGFGLPTIYVVNAIVVLGVWVHAELLVRVRFKDYVMEDLYHIKHGYYFNRPNLRSQLSDKEYSTEYLTNKDGFRIGYSQQLEATFSTVDWLFIGDSYTQGAQVQFEELYTTLLYRHFPNKIVLNAGISGWGIPQEAAYLRDALKRHRPKLVVLQVSSFNDFMKVFPTEATFSDQLMQRSLLVRLILQNIKYENPASLPLGRWAEPFYPDVRSNTRFNIFFKKSSPEKERDLAAYSRYLREMAREVRASNAQLVLVLIPTKEQIHFPHFEEVVEGFRLDPRDLDMDRPRKFLQHLSDSLAITLIDAQPAFEETNIEPFFEYDEHLNPHGHTVLAELLTERLAPEAGPESTILSRDYAGDRYPTYAPDGSLMYQSLAGGNMELFRADAAFEESTRLTYNDVPESHPVLSVNGRLAFTEGDPSNGNTRVVLARSDGSGRIAVQEKPYEFGAIPAFSPDGKRLAFAAWSVKGGSFTAPRILVKDLEDGGTHEVTNGSSETWRPIFSPDGRQLAYIQKVDSQFDIFIADLSTGAVDRLTETPWDEWDPSFSQDGRQLVFAAKADGNWDLFSIALVNRRLTRLTLTQGNEWDPVFTPDGDSITYAGEYGAFSGIYRISAQPK